MATSLVQRQEEVDKILMREPRSLDQEGTVGQEERQVAMYSGMARRLCCSGYGRRRMPGREGPSLRWNISGAPKSSR